MPRYPVTKLYSRLYTGLLVFCLGTALFMLTDEISALTIIVASLMGFGSIFSYIYVRLNDFQFANVQMDNNGITMLIGKKEYPLLWSECKAFGILGSLVEKAGPYSTSTYWVYCAKRPLSGYEEQWFLSKTRKKLDVLCFFQYSEEPFKEFLKHIPPEDAQRLQEQVSRIKMNPIEKFHNPK